MKRTLAFMMLITALVLSACSRSDAQLAPAQQDRKAATKGDLFTIAQVHYGGGGDWYEDRTAIGRLLQRINREFGLPVSNERKTVRLTDEDLFSYPMLFITGHGNVSFTQEESARLRAWFERGGFMWACDDYGMDKAFRREMKKVLPESEFKELPFDHPIYSAPYRFASGPPKIHEHAGGQPHGYGLFLNSRMVVFYDTNTDIADGLEAPAIHNDPPEKREQAFRMAVNIVYYFMTN